MTEEEVKPNQEQTAEKPTEVPAAVETQEEQKKTKKWEILWDYSGYLILILILILAILTGVIDSAYNRRVKQQEEAAVLLAAQEAEAERTAQEALEIQDTPEPTQNPIVYPDFQWDNENWGSNAIVDGMYYFVGVNRIGGVVTVYAMGEDGTYDVPVRAMLCSAGEETPLTPVGEAWYTTDKYRWRALSGNVYGQYATRINGPYLFHSVPYYTPSENDLEYPEFNKLGTIASMGCIRMSIVDTKWIFDNCPAGTPVVIYDDETCPGPLGKPENTLLIDEENKQLRGWDPTDPALGNPYHQMEDAERYAAGTAVQANEEKIITGLGKGDELGPIRG